nr:class II heat shock protein [Tanacetum cinerariifolium]
MASGSDGDAQDALSKLLKLGTVAEYESRFVILANRVTGISANLLKSFYIFGLKLALQIELLRSRPTTLGEAFSLARITEARFEDEWSTTTYCQTKRPKHRGARITLEEVLYPDNIRKSRITSLVWLWYYVGGGVVAVVRWCCVSGVMVMVVYGDDRS